MRQKLLAHKLQCNSMTVKELQDLLSSHNPDAIVLLNGDAGILAEVWSDDEDSSAVVYLSPH